MSIRLVQQGACDMMCACAVQKRPEECIGFMWPVGPYIPRERRVGQWIESFRYCHACSGWVGGHGNTRRPGYIRDLQGPLSPPVPPPLPLATDTPPLRPPPLDNSKCAP